MANLDLIKQLNKTYGKSSPVTNATKLFSFNESLDPDSIQKAITNSIANLGPAFTKYFDLGLPADVALLFIDVCGFSTRLSHLNGEEIGEYFDEYYGIVIPIIYDYGGEIDKIMGDGIICVFGPPFLDNSLVKNIAKAVQCSKEIIKATKGTKFSSKVAMHSGKINYFKNKTGLYKEFTMVGKPLTELFRLESISENERVNYYDKTDVRSYYLPKFSNSASASTTPAEWSHSKQKIENLKGVDFENFYSIKHNR
jgi:hypothetical protein